jgi:DNA-binding response OmpR family regulator
VDQPEQQRTAPRVLVADDEPDVRALVRVAVERAGGDVVRAVGDGTAALTAARDERPDLAVLDVAMPGASGLEVCAALRADAGTAGTRVLLLSAGATEDDVARGLAAGADLYLVKPFAVSFLVDQIRWLVEGPAEQSRTAAAS